MNNFGYEEIKKFVRLVEKSEINELEIVQEGTTLRIRKEASATVIQQNTPQNTVLAAPGIPSEITTDNPEVAPQVKAPEPSGNFYEQKSPMVGTFYRASSPEAEPYVRTGDIVEAGTILCIIEAMKLMNEIEAETSGKIVKICVDNAKPVEFGQVLFEIDPNG